MLHCENLARNYHPSELGLLLYSHFTVLLGWNPLFNWNINAHERKTSSTDRHEPRYSTDVGSINRSRGARTLCNVFVATPERKHWSPHWFPKRARKRYAPPCAPVLCNNIWSMFCRMRNVNICQQIKEILVTCIFAWNVRATLSRLPDPNKRAQN